MSLIKSKAEIKVMREGGRLLAQVLNRVKKETRSGISTLFLNNIAEKLILKKGATPSFKGYKGYPYSICVSISNQVVHGLPSEKIIRPGDIVSLDLGIRWKGFCTDAAITVGIPPISPLKQKLIEITQKALMESISIIKEGIFLGNVQFLIQKIIEEAGLSVIKDLAGHGIGTQPQEPPTIFNFGKPGRGLKLKAGMILCLEPMASIGSGEISLSGDGFTIQTVDGKPAAHFEHTIAVTKNGSEILTLL